MKWQSSSQTVEGNIDYPTHPMPEERRGLCPTCPPPYAADHSRPTQLPLSSSFKCAPPADACTDSRSRCSASASLAAAPAVPGWRCACTCIFSSFLCKRRTGKAGRQAGGLDNSRTTAKHAAQHVEQDLVVVQVVQAGGQACGWANSQPYQPASQPAARHAVIPASLEDRCPSGRPHSTPPPYTAHLQPFNDAILLSQLIL